MSTSTRGPLDLEAFDGVVQQKSAPEQISDHILSAIAVGALPAGTRLPAERELADALSVSRSSVRIALDRLSELNVVTRQRGKSGGTFVNDIELTSHDFSKAVTDLAPFWQERESLLDARALIQQQIGRTAAVRRSESDLASIRNALGAYEQADEAATARAADRIFHNRLAEGAHNVHLLTMATDLDRAINLGFRHDPYSTQLHQQAVEQHAAIVAAIELRDEDEAGRLADRHFRSTTMEPLRSGN
ncbi:FCD domain-containing protein [Saxibacter everestensis]|uniref:FCD domain-containing protein n=1 Tax=Saxibacter everestensis TaxID=2909229 RepID=A0ABY8QYK8_9MICO|nr:FCD domain-containing protein [Brevibacteriaceae bacterium ZFBP1038]